MYQNYFGLAELPFELTANPRYLFLTARQREALSVLQYGLFSAKPITVLIGEAGTGKTSLIHAAFQSERCRDVRAVYVDNPLLDTDDFVRMLALKFDLGSDALASKSILLTRLEATLRERRARGEIVALVVDEAQGLNVGVLEELRLLANIETPMSKLLPLVLAGQPELGDRLEQPEMRQLKQRITLRCELTPFEVTDTAGYIAGRIKAAGGVASRLFTQEAVLLIHEASRGIARSINVICDNALLNAMALGLPRVDRAMVIEVCRDLRLNASVMNQPLRAPSAPAQAPHLQGVGAQPADPEHAGEDETAGDTGRASASVSQRIFRFPFRFGASAAVQRFQQNGR